MASKKEQEILDKIKIVLTRTFESPVDAFNFFDQDNDQHLNRVEVIALLKESDVNRFIQSMVASKLMEKFDQTSDQFISWTEFEEAVGSLFPQEVKAEEE